MNTTARSEDRDPAISKLRGVNIIFVFGNLERGGAERQGLYLARYLKERCGAHVQIWGLNERPGKLSVLCEQSDIPWRGFSFPLSKVKALLYLALLARSLKKEKPDILLPYTYFPNVVCGLVWKFTGAKLCVWNQRDEALNLNTTFWQKAAVSSTPRFIANSTNAKDALVRLYQLREDNVQVIHNGISLPPPAASREVWRKRLHLSPETFVACMLANIHQDKDHVTLLKAWRAVLDMTKQEQAAPVLLLAGRCHEYGEKMKSLASELDLGDCIRFIGEVDDVSGLFRAVDLCVHSSKSEGLPNGVLEAMSAGLPIVGTNIPGIREAVGDAGIHFLAPPGNSDMLAAHIFEFFQDPLLRTKIGYALQKRVREEFDLALMCTRTTTFLSRVY